MTERPDGGSAASGPDRGLAAEGWEREPRRNGSDKPEEGSQAEAAHQKNPRPTGQT